jgi:hypothetical protein
MNIDHMDSGAFLESAPRGQSWCQRMQATLQRDLETIGQECNEDVGVGPALSLMEDWRIAKSPFGFLNASSTATSVTVWSAPP